jgi:hypothetical protein
MRIWFYDRVTGELAGESVADPDPMEENGWILPAFSTSVEPPEVPPGHAARFAGSLWGWPRIIAAKRGGRPTPRTTLLRS